MKNFLLMLLIVIIVFSLTCKTADADGSFTSLYPDDVYMTEQLVLICLDNDKVDLVIEIKYELIKSENFGWIIPLPNIPEIDTESESLSGIFEELSYLTSDDLPLQLKPIYIGDNPPPSASEHTGPTIIEQVKVGIYEVTILEATSSDDLVEWFSANDFIVPDGAEEVFQDYIDDGWIFVTMKLEPPEKKYGYVHPIHLTFNSESPVFPMKLTEFSSEDTDLLMYVAGNDEWTFSGATKEWGYYIDKSTLNPIYPIAYEFFPGDVFLTKLSRDFSINNDTYDDIVLQEIEPEETVEIWPNSGAMTPNDGHTFRASGGVPPYTWSISDATVGEINPDTGEFLGAKKLGTFMVIAEDAMGNIGSSGEITVANRPVIDTGSENGSCFIATAAYGSHMEPHVKILRDFRDRFLLTNSIGKAFVDFYYGFSPPIAELIAHHETIRVMVRWGLIPLVCTSWVILKLGPVPCLLIIFLSGLGLTGIIRMNRRFRKVSA